MDTNGGGGVSIWLNDVQIGIANTVANDWSQWDLHITTPVAAGTYSLQVTSWSGGGFANGAFSLIHHTSELLAIEQP